MAEQVPFETVLEALLDEEHIFPAGYLHLFSDLETEQLKQLEMIWPKILPTRKQALLEDLEILASKDTLLCYDNMAINLLADADPTIRMMAIRLLWECENPKLIPIYLEIIKNDPSRFAKAEAASVLGVFIYMGEVEKIPAVELKLIEEELILLAVEGTDELIRRKAIESLGFSSREEVVHLIAAAFSSNKTDLKISALVAIGRSNDPIWENEVLEGIDHDNDLIRLEAVQAAGNLGLEAARPILLEMLEDLNDPEIIKATLWSLSQIGGEDVREKIEEMYEYLDPDEEDFIDEVLENLNLTEEMASFDFLVVAADPDLDDKIDLMDET
jgi:hypothetical protein